MARKLSSTMMLFGGSVVGAGLALLFAPCSGAKSRKRMAKLSKSMGKKSNRFYRDFNDSMSDFADRMGSMSKGMMHRWS